MTTKLMALHLVKDRIDKNLSMAEIADSQINYLLDTRNEIDRKIKQEESISTGHENFKLPELQTSSTF